MKHTLCSHGLENVVGTIFRIDSFYILVCNWMHLQISLTLSYSFYIALLERTYSKQASYYPLQLTMFSGQNSVFIILCKRNQEHHDIFWNKNKLGIKKKKALEIPFLGEQPNSHQLLNDFFK